MAIATLSVVLTSCTDYKSQVESLTRERAQLMSEASAKDSSINEFIMAINQLDSSVSEITARQQLVMNESSDAELKADAKTSIIQNVQALDKMLTENKEKLAALASKLKKSNLRISELEKMITNLQLQLAMKDSEMLALNDHIGELNLAVANLNATVDTLSRENQSKAATIAEKTNTINKAYYIVGNYKDLKAKGIISKDGGFLGMGKSEMLMRDFNRKDFSMIDITKFEKLPINAKKVQIVTSHPSDSYKLNMDAKKFVTDITITNSENFWSASKYLVIMTE